MPLEIPLQKQKIGRHVVNNLPKVHIRVSSIPIPSVAEEGRSGYLLNGESDHYDLLREA